MVTAELKNYRQSPRKVRLVADTIRGKDVTEAILTLSFVPKRAADPIKKLLESAVANAKHNFELTADNLYVKTVLVDPGFVMMRSMPKWRGTSHPIRKKTSHVKIFLATKDGAVVASKASATKEAVKPKAVKEPKKTAEKTVTKKTVATKKTKKISE
jgi:large subunit ribosomal protein L22